MKKGLKVLFVAAEASNLIKVGGLGDVVGELPLKLMEMGAEVRLALPAYRDIHAELRYDMDFGVPMGYRTETCILRKNRDSGIETWLLDNYHYFNRPGVYGYQDDPERFAFFCLALFELLKKTDFIPDVIHLHDWHTAPLAMLIKERRTECPHLARSAIVYTVHNLEYQGVCGQDVFHMYGVNPEAFTGEKIEYYGCFNPMKCGLFYADRIVAVSPSYAKEIQKKQNSFGLDGVVRAQAARLSGIVNGISQTAWNPQTDGALVQNYTIETASLKRENKLELQKELGLTLSAGPLCSFVSRLAPNKGAELLEDAAGVITNEGGQLVVLGTGDADLERFLRGLETLYAGKIAVRNTFDSRLARRIYAASDIYLMPSRLEPCGIGQQIAMRYGAVPVAHDAGGLSDTLKDVSLGKDIGTGFLFTHYSPKAFQAALRRAMRMYRREEADWKSLVKRIMSRDASWDKPAADYMKLYHDALMEKRADHSEETLEPKPTA